MSSFTTLVSVPQAASSITGGNSNEALLSSIAGLVDATGGQFDNVSLNLGGKKVVLSKTGDLTLASAQTGQTTDTIDNQAVTPATLAQAQAAEAGQAYITSSIGGGKVQTNADAVAAAATAAAANAPWYESTTVIVTGLLAVFLVGLVIIRRHRK